MKPDFMDQVIEEAKNATKIPLTPYAETLIGKFERLNEIGDFVGTIIQRLYKDKKNLSKQIIYELTKLEEGDKVIYKGEEYHVYSIYFNHPSVTITIWLASDNPDDDVFPISDFRTLVKINDDFIS